MRPRWTITSLSRGAYWLTSVRPLVCIERVGNCALADVRFTVFGCGNSDWANTYQRIPTLVDDLLAKGGAKRLFERGAGAAGTSQFFQTFDDWEAGMWAALTKEYSMKHSDTLAQTLELKTVDAGKERAAALHQEDAMLGRVVENRVLTKAEPVTPSRV